ncbi:MAG: hypothetical protein HKN39_02440 [Flavobacteriales bacterium]|nr:hypothetical protein [Flavobacteriales bacterium]
MHIQKSTPVPNVILDQTLPYLNQAELKVLLIIVRQTLGWYDPKTKKRKSKDWIAISFFIRKTGLSAKSISIALSELIRNDLVLAFDEKGKILKTAQDRRGKKRIYYAYAPYYRYVHDETWVDKLAHLFTYRPKTKETPTKEIRTKEIASKKVHKQSDSERVLELLRQKLNQK